MNIVRYCQDYFYPTPPPLSVPTDVAWSVCVFVGHSREPAKQQTDQDATGGIIGGANWRNLANTIGMICSGVDAGCAIITVADCSVFPSSLIGTHTHSRLTAFFQDYLGKPVPEG